MTLVIQIFTALLTLALVAEGHQPFESNARVLFDGDRMELNITTSLPIAETLAGGSSINSASLGVLHQQLVKTGPALYEVAANGKPLKAERAFFTLRDEDAVFSIIYPLERATELSFRAAFLDRLPNGYGTLIEVFDEDGESLGRQARITKGPAGARLVLQVPKPASDPAPQGLAAAGPSPAPASPGAEASSSDRQKTRGYLLLGGIFALPVLAAGFRRFHRTASH